MTQTQSIFMWRSPLALLGLGLSCCIFAPSLHAVEQDSLRHTSTVRAIQAAEPAVVNIEGNKPANPTAVDSHQVNGMGAGVLIDSRGYILTNQHVVQDVGRIEVTLHDGTEHIGRLIARDAATDLALVKISSRSPLPVISCGTSSDLMLGEKVIAIGNPFGYHHTVTEGIISALHRDIPVNGTQTYPDLIQTDASINPGNSGGPLLNADGDMIGINAAVRIGAQGIGFAIPVDRAVEIAADMIAQHRRGAFESPLSVTTKFGGGRPRVEVVRAGGTQLQRGDVITAVGKRAVQNRLDYELALLDQTAGADIEVDVERAGQRLSSRLALDARSEGRAQLTSATSSATTSEKVYLALGLRLERADAAKVLDVDPSYKGGLKVTSVRRGSPANKAQLQTGDILVGLLEWQTPDWEDLSWILNRNEFQANTGGVKFYIMRGKEVFWGTLDMSEGQVR